MGIESVRPWAEDLQRSKQDRMTLRGVAIRRAIGKGQPASASEEVRGFSMGGDLGASSEGGMEDARKGSECAG